MHVIWFVYPTLNERCSDDRPKEGQINVLPWKAMQTDREHQMCGKIDGGNEHKRNLYVQLFGRTKPYTASYKTTCSRQCLNTGDNILHEHEWHPEYHKNVVP